MVDKWLRARSWTREHGVDLPEVTDWRWTDGVHVTGHGLGNLRRRRARSSSTPDHRATAERCYCRTVVGHALATPGGRHEGGDPWCLPLDLSVPARGGDQGDRASRPLIIADSEPVGASRSGRLAAVHQLSGRSPSIPARSISASRVWKPRSKALRMRPCAVASRTPFPKMSES
jgi:hypothetical protein